VYSRSEDRIKKLEEKAAAEKAAADKAEEENMEERNRKPVVPAKPVLGGSGRKPPVIPPKPILRASLASQPPQAEEQPKPRSGSVADRARMFEQPPEAVKKSLPPKKK